MQLRSMNLAWWFHSSPGQFRTDQQNYSAAQSYRAEVVIPTWVRPHHPSFDALIGLTLGVLIVVRSLRIGGRMR